LCDAGTIRTTVLFLVQRAVCGAENVLGGKPVARILRDANARGQARNFEVFA
jgi:hypothetical protein